MATDDLLIERLLRVIDEGRRTATYKLALLLGIILTAIYVVGLLDRRNQTILRMGYDSLAAIIVFAGGIVVLAFAGG